MARAEMGPNWRRAARPLRPALASLRAYLTAPLHAEIAGLRAALRDTPAPSPPLAPPPAPAAADVNQLLHDGRSALLRRMPKGAHTFLSAGCAGLWFFEWIERCYGAIPRHIGLEYYAPRPDGLPANVTWIANTCSDMAGVADQSCDLVFSGQNVEHLWPEEVTGFLAEAARVTRPGGYLVMDSPNRAITAPLGWSHPEHTVELTVAEAVELVELAGFDVIVRRGIWLGRNPDSGATLPFVPAQDAPLSVPERLMLALDDPENAFLWWIEGRRGTRPPARERIEARMAAIFAEAWPERLRRMARGVGQEEMRNGARWCVCPEGVAGPLLFGPYAPLRAGRYRCTFHLESAPDGAARAVLDVVAGEAGETLCARTLDIAPGPSTVSLDFTLPELRFGLQFRCISAGTGGFACRREVDLALLA